MNRLRFDDDAYVHRLAETVGPGQYQTATPRICDGCVPYAPGVNLDRQAGSVTRTSATRLTDIDSDLRGITRRASDCPARQYLGPGKENGADAAPYPHAECAYPHGLTPEPTLLSNPKCTGRETTINRWEWLCADPQGTALASFDHMVSNRIVVKDNHRPCIERPLDQSAALPPPCNTNVVIDWSRPFCGKPPPCQVPEAPALMTCAILSAANGIA